MLGLAALTSAVAAFAPLIQTSKCAATSLGSMRCSAGRTSLVAHEGAAILAVLAIPPIVAALPVIYASRKSAMACAIVLTAATLIAAASVGMFLIPTVLLAWVAAIRHGPPASPADEVSTA